MHAKGFEQRIYIIFLVKLKKNVNRKLQICKLGNTEKTAELLTALSQNDSWVSFEACCLQKCVASDGN